jgi:hypothetical protein
LHAPQRCTVVVLWQLPPQQPKPELQLVPHAPQCAVVFRSSHTLLQHAWPEPQVRPHAPQWFGSFWKSTQCIWQQSLPAPHGLFGPHAAMHVPVWQTWPAAHWLSIVQLLHEWSARQVPLGHSAFVLQPRSHTKS